MSLLTARDVFVAIEHVLSGGDFPLLILIAVSIIFAVGLSLLPNDRVTALAARRRPYMASLVLIIPAIVVALWHIFKIASNFSLDAAAIPVAIWWYLIAGVLVSGGYGLTIISRDTGRTGAARTAFAMYGTIAIGLGVGLVLFRYFELRGPRSSGSSDSVSGGASGGLSDTLAIMALVLTVLTGIAVHYISSSLSLISQQRREIDSEISIAKKMDSYRVELEEASLRMNRLRFYQQFNEKHGESFVLRRDSAGIAPDYALLRRAFRQHDSPKPDERPPYSLQDCYVAVHELALDYYTPSRHALEREHLEAIRAFHQRTVMDPNLQDEARTRFQEIMERLEGAIEADRRRTT